MTPSGKPQKGDLFVHLPTDSLVEVTNRLPGHSCYTVDIIIKTGPEKGRKARITEWDYHAPRSYKYVSPE